VGIGAQTQEVEQVVQVPFQYQLRVDVDGRFIRASFVPDRPGVSPSGPVSLIIAS